MLKKSRNYNVKLNFFICFLKTHQTAWYFRSTRRQRVSLVQSPFPIRILTSLRQDHRDNSPVPSHFRSRWTKCHRQKVWFRRHHRDEFSCRDFHWSMQLCRRLKMRWWMKLHRREDNATWHIRGISCEPIICIPCTANKAGQPWWSVRMPNTRSAEHSVMAMR